MLGSVERTPVVSYALSAAGDWGTYASAVLHKPDPAVNSSERLGNLAQQAAESTVLVYQSGHYPVPSIWQG
jgi:hypothetical protein